MYILPSVFPSSWRSFHQPFSSMSLLFLHSGHVAWVSGRTKEQIICSLLQKIKNQQLRKKKHIKKYAYICSGEIQCLNSGYGFYLSKEGAEQCFHLSFYGDCDNQSWCQTVGLNHTSTEILPCNRTFWNLNWTTVRKVKVQIALFLQSKLLFFLLPLLQHASNTTFCKSVCAASSELTEESSIVASSLMICSFCLTLEKQKLHYIYTETHTILAFWR